MFVRGISLDAAGTIIRIREPVAQTYTEIANRHDIPIDAPTIDKAFRTIFPRMAPLAFGASQGAALQRQERDWWRTLVRNCLGRFGQHPGFNGFFDEVYRYYAEPSAWQVYDDVAPLLTQLAALRIPVVVTSNFDTRLHGILRGFALHDAFREVLCSSVVGSAKPDSGIFAAACTALGITPTQVLHVGDDRRADFTGAQAAGLSAKWLNRRPGASSERDEVASLAAVSAVLTT